MRKLGVFNSVTMDGYFTGENGDLSWAYKNSNDPEWQAFVAGNARGGGQLLFGRKTYDMMASYWPTPMAMEQNPEVARGMNEMKKYVVSTGMEKVGWQNTTIISGNLVEEITALKQSPGDDLVILGSGTVVSQLTAAGLIDTLQIVVCPVVIGKGRTMFEGIELPLEFKLVNSRLFKNGKLVVWYEKQSV